MEHFLVTIRSSFAVNTCLCTRNISGLTLCTSRSSVFQWQLIQYEFCFNCIAISGLTKLEEIYLSYSFSSKPLCCGWVFNLHYRARSRHKLAPSFEALVRMRTGGLNNQIDSVFGRPISNIIEISATVQFTWSYQTKIDFIPRRII